MNNGPEQVMDKDGEGSVSVVRHWGCQWDPVRFPDGIRWDPGYGSGIYVPYSEAEARVDVARTPGSQLVSRTETTIVVTTKWEETA